MSRNGSGTYSLPVNSWNPANNGTPATAADWQALINDVAAAITQSLSRDGQTSLTGNLQMGSNKLTGLGVGTAAGDSLAWQQLFSQGQPLDLASAATTDIGLQNTTVLNITGTTTITSFGLNYNGPRFLRFAGALTLTHNATTLILPGAANITTAANDSAIVVPSGVPSNGWRVISYVRGAGTLLPNSVSTNAVQDDAITFAKTQNIPTASFLGRTGAGTGDIEVLTPEQAAALLPAPVVSSKIQPILATVSGNALTLTLNPTTLDFRSTDLTLGNVATISNSAAVTLTVPQGATLGAVSGQPVRLVVIAIRRSGAIELAVINLAGAGNLDESGVISTTAISAASNSAAIAYSTASAANLSYRVVGYIDSTQATAGTYATAPTLVQGAGGQSLQHVGPMVYLPTVTASGTSVDFVGLPVWVSRIAIMPAGLSTTGTSPVQVQIGAGALVTTGYQGAAMLNQTGAVVNNHTTGFRIEPTDALVVAASTRHGTIFLNRALNGTWHVTGGTGYSNNNVITSLAGSLPLTGSLDRVRVTTVGGTDTFDAGTISIYYE